MISQEFSNVYSAQHYTEGLDAKPQESNKILIHL